MSVNITQTMTKITTVTLRRERTVNGNWLLEIPQHAITALNKSSVTNYGTSFDNNTAVQLWMVSGGTWAGITGTAIGIFIGTSIAG